ncbi:MAG: hypothetical protein JNK25_04230 [Phycisphaerae bacterium]|nr:hypothetical protein [Phycisphaerae bacterium]
MKRAWLIVPSRARIARGLGVDAPVVICGAGPAARCAMREEDPCGVPPPCAGARAKVSEAGLLEEFGEFRAAF